MKSSVYPALILALATSGLASPTPEPTAAPAPPEPVLLEPLDGTRLGLDGPIARFVWENVCPECSYEIEFGLDPDFAVGSGPLPADGTGLDLADWIAAEDWTGLSVSIWWRARSRDGPAASSWSEAWVLHKSSFAAPEVHGPQMGARMGPADPPPQLEWQAFERAAEYELGFWADAAGGAPLGSIWWPQAELDLAPLVPAPDWEGTSFTLYWAAAAAAEDGVPGPWSELQRLSRSVLAAPVLLAPGDGVYLAPVGSPPVFAWSEVGGAIAYEVGFWLLEADGFPLLTLEFEEPCFDLRAYVSQAGWTDIWGTIAWSVSVIDPQGNAGGWSPPAVMSKLGRHNMLAYGDSITGGWGSAGFPESGGYGPILEDMLHGALDPRLNVITVFVPGGQAWAGLRDLEEALRIACPTQVMTMFGTLDLISPRNCEQPYNCQTLQRLLDISARARAIGAVPFLATLPPPNPDDWASILDMEAGLNIELRQVASAHGIGVADVHEYFMAYPGDLADLYYDYLHPNDRGYEQMAYAWYDLLVP